MSAPETPPVRDDALPPLPNVLLVGAQKCGTSALAGSLRAHPEIFMPANKELHHFGEVPDAEAAGPAYRRLFEGWHGERWVGEATPAYLYLPDAGPQIGRHLPGVRALAVLRNPVDRAYSAYWHGRIFYSFRGSFEEALADEPRRVAAGEWAWAPLVDRGRYIGQLERFVDAGVSREQFHVLLHDDLVADQAGALEGIAGFLGLASPLAPLERSNESRRQVLPAVVGRRLQRRVVEEFRADNAALGEWLGRDLSHWDA